MANTRHSARVLWNLNPQDRRSGSYKEAFSSRLEGNWVRRRRNGQQLYIHGKGGRGHRGLAAGTWPWDPDVEKALSPLFTHQEAEAQGRPASFPRGAVALRPESLLLTDSQEASSLQEPPTPGYIHPRLRVGPGL